MQTIRPIYTDGSRISPILRDLIGDSITINDAFIKDRLLIGGGDRRRRLRTFEHETPFDEIKIMPYEQAFKPHKEASCFISQNLAALDKKAYLEAFEKVIDSNWNPSSFHLIYHSSGFDSRLISHFIRKKYENDPGRVLFVCWGSECETFEKIMRYEKWDRSQYATIPAETEKLLYRFDFSDVWEHVNGASWNFSASMYHTALDFLRKSGRIPQDLSRLQIWVGIGSNEMIKWPGRLDLNLKRSYYGWQMRMWGVIGKDTIQPFMDIGPCKVLYNSKNRKENVRRELVRMADPELANFPRTATSKLFVPIEARKKAINDFKSSYYYKKIDGCSLPKLIKNILMYDGRHRSYHAFWRKWTLASLIEKLIRKGIEIKCEKKN